MGLPIVQPLTPSIATGIVAVISIGLWLVTRRKNGGLPYPPGPKGLPFIGNALDLNLKEPHATYTQWAEQYGAHLLCSCDFSVSQCLTRGHCLLSYIQPRFRHHKFHKDS